MHDAAITGSHARPVSRSLATPRTTARPQANSTSVGQRIALCYRPLAVIASTLAFIKAVAIASTP